MAFKLAVLATHPIQYQAPWHAYLAAHPEISLKVFFCHDYGVRPQKSSWGVENFTWNAPLLEGYEFEFLPNWSTHPGPERMTGSFNPHILARMVNEQFDAWILNGWGDPTSLMALAAGRALGRKLLLRVETNLLAPVSLGKRTFRRILRPWILNRCAGFLAIGRANANFYRHYGVPEEKIFSVPYSANNDRWRAEAEIHATRVEEARRALAIASDAVVFLFCARFDPVKRIFDLLEAFERVAAVHDRAHLVLVGSGPLLEDAKARASTIPRTTFLGFRNQDAIAEVYALSDVIVLPSSSETWGLVVNEAMNFANAVIVSDRCGCGLDLVEGRGTGTVFPAGDVPALEAAMVRFVVDEAALRAAQSNARAVVQNYSYRTGAEGVLEALHSLTNGSANEP